MYADPSDSLWCRQRIGLNMVGTSTCMNETDVKDALHSAVKQCCVHAIEMFPPEAIRGWRFSGHTLLHAAVIYGCHEPIPILAMYVGANTCNEYGETALDVAARIGNAEAARLLLDVGADPTATNKHGETPLHTAVYDRHADVVELFLSRGADPNARNAYGETPLHVAALVGDVVIAKLLIKSGADINARDSRGRTPLHHTALWWRGARAVKLLAESGADVNARDNKGNTPLHAAVENRNIRTIKELLKVGADPTARNNEGLTPRDAAARRGYMCIAEMLF